MKKLIITLFIAFIGQLAFAQGNKTDAVITPAFVDSLKSQIKTIMAAGYEIKLVYVSAMSDEGKLLKPLVWRQTNSRSDTETDHTNMDFLNKIRELIKAAPAWKPATEVSTNKPVACEVKFSVDIVNGVVKIDQTK